MDVIGEKEGANKKDSESRLGLVSRMVSSRRYLGLDVAFKLGIPKQMNPSLARSDTLHNHDALPEPLQRQSMNILFL